MSLVDPARVDTAPDGTPAASRTTVVVSLAAHLVVVVALVVAPLFAQVNLPAPSRSIEAFIQAKAYKAVPVPEPPGRPNARPTPAAAPAPVAPSSDAAPTEAPTSIAEGDPAPPSVVTNRRAFTVLVRNELFRRVQLAALLLRVVHPGDPGADLEPQGRVVAQRAGHGGQVLATHEQGHLAAVDDDALDGLAVRGGATDEGGLEPVGDVVDGKVVHESLKEPASAQ